MIQSQIVYPESPSVIQMCDRCLEIDLIVIITQMHNPARFCIVMLDHGFHDRIIKFSHDHQTRARSSQ